MIMAKKKPDTWWDIWLPEDTRELTEDDILQAIARPFNSDIHFRMYTAEFLKLARKASENLNREISSGIDQESSYRTGSKTIPVIVKEDLPKDKVYLISYEELYKPFIINKL